VQEKIRVLIVDDSDLVRGNIQAILGSEPTIEIVGTARNGEEGVEKASLLRPSVITMDLEMPVMNGHDAIDRIMKETPTPIIVVSGQSTEAIMKTLDLGAMDFIALSGEIEDIADDLIDKVKIASRVKALRRIRTGKRLKTAGIDLKSCESRVIAIGISTGGPQALKTLFSAIPPDLPAGILVVQHMSPGFIEGMVEWLGNYSSIEIRIAEQWARIENARAYVAPDYRHMEIDRDGKIRLSRENDGTMMHVPSIDVMMQSVASSFGEKAIGLVMTGMGKDGVAGLKAIRESGGRTIAQDESSSVIYGMNKVAIEAGIVDSVVSLEDISTEIVRIIETESGNNGSKKDTDR